MRVISVFVVSALVVPALAVGGQGGEKIFQQKCKVCHKMNGVGGKLGPDLTNVSARRDETYIRSKLKDPSQTNPDTVMPSFETLSPGDVDSVVEFLKEKK